MRGAPATSLETTPATAICVDFGSTFTKAALVDLAEGRIVAQASHPTTIDTDVLDGYDACLAALREQDPRAEGAEVLACSSAGGGLRIAVVGNEELVTAEAGRRVALSSGGRVVEVVAAAGRAPESAFWRTLSHTTRPDVVLLTGGTDGGNTQVDRGRGEGDRGRRLDRAGRGTPATSTLATRSRRCWGATRTSSPTTWCPGSASSRPSPRAGRSARCSCPT